MFGHDHLSRGIRPSFYCCVYNAVIFKDIPLAVSGPCGLCKQLYKANYTPNAILTLMYIKMEQSPTNRVTFHVRLVNLLSLLLILDIVLANHAIQVTLSKGPTMMIMFGFEVNKRGTNRKEDAELIAAHVVHYFDMHYTLCRW